MARALSGTPMSPRTANPNIDNAVMSVLGACLFKDPYKRAKDARFLVETLEKLDADAMTFAQQLEKKVSHPAASHVESRRSILLVTKKRRKRDGRGVGENRIAHRARGEQRVDLGAQLRVVATRGREIRRSSRRVELERRVEQRLERDPSRARQ